MPVRVLLCSGGEFVAIDEYDPKDGRVHILNDHQYGTYDEAGGTLERHKAVSEVTEVIYAGHSWPSDMPRPAGFSVVYNYFNP